MSVCPCPSSFVPARLSCLQWSHAASLGPAITWMCQLGSGPRLSLQPIFNWCHHLSVAPVAFLKLLIWREHYTASRWASERKDQVQPECCECRLHFFLFKKQFSTSNCHWVVPKASSATICLLLLDAAWEFIPDLAPGFQSWSVSRSGMWAAL